MASILKAGLPPAPRPATLPPIRYAAAAAAAVTPQTPSSQAPLQAPVTTHPPPPNNPQISPATTSVLPAQSVSQDQLSSSPSLTHQSVTSPMLSSSASVSQQPDGSFYSGVESPAMSEAVPSSHNGPMAESPLLMKGVWLVIHVHVFVNWPISFNTFAY